MNPPTHEELIDDGFVFVGEGFAGDVPGRLYRRVDPELGQEEAFIADDIDHAEYGIGGDPAGCFLYGVDDEFDREDFES